MVLASLVLIQSDRYSIDTFRNCFLESCDAASRSALKMMRWCSVIITDDDEHSKGWRSFELTNGKTQERCLGVQYIRTKRYIRSV